MAESNAERYKVKLTSISNPSDRVYFNVSPELTESRNVNYKSLDLIHMPGNIFAYSNSSARSFSMVAKLVSRTVVEATNNAAKLRMLRSWTMPYFGTGTNNGEIGSPPDVLYLDAYSDGNATKPRNEQTISNIFQIPVVLTQLTNSYPSDMTYIPTDTGEPFPVIMNVDVLMTESHSPKEYSTFSLADFKAGNLSHF